MKRSTNEEFTAPADTPDDAVGEVHDAEVGPAFLLEAVNDYGIVAANEGESWMLVTADDPHAGWLARDGAGRIVVGRSPALDQGLGLLVLGLAIVLQLGRHTG